MANEIGELGMVLRNGKSVLEEIDEDSFVNPYELITSLEWRKENQDYWSSFHEAENRKRQAMAGISTNVPNKGLW